MTTTPPTQPAWTAADEARYEAMTQQYQAQRVAEREGRKVAERKPVVAWTELDNEKALS